MMDPQATAAALEDLCADGVLAIPDAARFLSISRAEVYRLFENGSLASVRIGRRRLVPKRSAVRLLAANLNAGAQG
jgi:excisionase family DNA binding protein